MSNTQKPLSSNIGVHKITRFFRENLCLSLVTKTLVLSSIGTVASVFTESVTFPQVAQAYTARVDIEIDTLNGENYATILRRAEAAARAAVQRSFDKDILTNDVSVIVSVQNRGAIAPVLELEVSRVQWRNRPDPRLWSKYFKTASALLYFQSINQGNNSPQNNISAPPPSIPEDNQPEVPDTQPDT